MFNHFFYFIYIILIITLIIPSYYCQAKILVSIAGHRRFYVWGLTVFIIPLPFTFLPTPVPLRLYSGNTAVRCAVLSSP